MRVCMHVGMCGKGKANPCREPGGKNENYEENINEQKCPKSNHPEINYGHPRGKCHSGRLLRIMAKARRQQKRATMLHRGVKCYSAS